VQQIEQRPQRHRLPRRGAVRFEPGHRLGTQAELASKLAHQTRLADAALAADADDLPAAGLDLLEALDQQRQLAVASQKLGRRSAGWRASYDCRRRTGRRRRLNSRNARRIGVVECRAAFAAEVCPGPAHRSALAAAHQRCAAGIAEPVVGRILGRAGRTLHAGLLGRGVRGFKGWFTGASETPLYHPCPLARRDGQFSP
jgi:hypothetical protein